MSLKLKVLYKGKEIEVMLDQNDTLNIFKKQLQLETHVPFIQQQVSYKVHDKKITLTDDQKPLKSLNIPSDVSITLKNLGKQIRWDYVFYIEYFGPIFIFPLLYLLGNSQNYTSIQCWALIMTLIHYAKREYQTAYVHVFSRYSMPLSRIFINCAHYWVFFALANGVELYLFPSGHTYDSWFIYTLFVLWSVFQFCNFKCHTILSSFRRNKQKSDSNQNISKRRGIPYGWGFDKISCANYFWQALGWITFSILTRCWTSYLFTALSIYQMTEWAVKKHQGYKKEFGDKYPRGRKAIFPFII